VQRRLLLAAARVTMSDKPATGVKPIFCGNFRYDEPRHHVEDLFRERGEMLRLDMKKGFAFVYMAKQEDAERCIAELHNHDLGGRKLLVSFAKGDGDTKRREDQRKANQQPTKTLFVANFELMRNDQFQTERELESRFLEYGKLTRCQLRAGRSGSYFAFVEYEEQVRSLQAACLAPA
jgi:RNA recognition motif-containing protein